MRRRSSIGVHLRFHHYSAFIPDIFTTLPHFAVSFRMNSANASGGVPAGSAPSAVSLSITSCCFNAFASSVCKRSMIGRGVPAGATMLYQALTSKPFSPASAAVGISG